MAAVQRIHRRIYVAKFPGYFCCYDSCAPPRWPDETQWSPHSGYVIPHQLDDL
jgi:hypothetical protein